MAKLIKVYYFIFPTQKYEWKRAKHLFRAQKDELFKHNKVFLQIKRKYDALKYISYATITNDHSTL